VSAGPAAAAVSVLGPGQNPRVAIDAGGSGHFTWTQIQPAGGDIFHYCRVPRGGGSCVARTTRNNTEQNLSGGYAFLPGGPRVLLLEARCCSPYARKLLYSSSNSGGSFDAGVSPGNENVVGANIAGEALYAPAGALGRPAESLLTISDLQTVGLSFQATGTTSNPAFATEFTMTSGTGYNGSLARQGNTLVAAWSTLDPDNVLWRAWSGSGDLNSSANWTPEAVVGPTNVDSNTRLAGGPSGIYLSYSVGSPGAQAFVVRRFTGSGFGPAITLSETGSPRFGDLFEDPAGRLHFAWQDSAGSLRYRYGTDSANTVFSRPQTLSAPRSDANFAALQLASGSTGHGFVTWNLSSSPGTVKSVPFAPGEPPPAGPRPAGLPAPVLGVRVNVAPIKGKVFVSPPAGAARAAVSVPGLKGRSFVPLTVARQIPVGSLLDTRKGTVRLTSARDTKGNTQAGDFSAGVFQVLQSRKATAKGLTELRLKGASFRSCRRSKRGRPASAAQRLSQRTVRRAARRLSRRTKRRLRSNAKGRFRTRGRYSAATVRGTVWVTADRCDGTLTTVKRGKIAVRDFRRKKTIIVRAGKRHLARARR
jgi:hypothetical protein